jgi:hypothetical protein
MIRLPLIGSNRTAALLRIALGDRLEGAQHDRRVVGGQQCRQLDHAVVMPVAPHTAAYPTLRRVLSRVGVRRPHVRAADALQLGAGGAQRDVEPDVLIGRRYHLGDHAQLVERQPSSCCSLAVERKLT